MLTDSSSECEVHNFLSYCSVSRFPIECVTLIRITRTHRKPNISFICVSMLGVQFELQHIYGRNQTILYPGWDMWYMSSLQIFYVRAIVSWHIVSKPFCLTNVSYMATNYLRLMATNGNISASIFLEGLISSHNLVSRVPCKSKD